MNLIPKILNYTKLYEIIKIGLNGFTTLIQFKWVVGWQNIQLFAKLVTIIVIIDIKIKGAKQMKHWLIQIENKKENELLTVYENGLVYGKERGQKLFILSSRAIEQIKEIINSNIYMFKTLEYFKEHHNPLILRINDTSRKHRKIKIVGWREMPKIMNIILNPQNYLKMF